MTNLSARIEDLERVAEARAGEVLTDKERAERLAELVAAGNLVCHGPTWEAKHAPYSRVAEILNRAEERRRNDGQPGTSH
jgi:hypothetical protein